MFINELMDLAIIKRYSCVAKKVCFLSEEYVCKSGMITQKTLTLHIL